MAGPGTGGTPERRTVGGGGRVLLAAVSLNRALGPYLGRRRYFDDWITAARSAQQSAHRGGDRPAEAYAWGALGSALRHAGRKKEAIDAHQEACALFETCDDLPQLAMARSALGIAFQEAGRLAEAVEVHGADAEAFRSLEDSWGEGLAWTNLGGALWNMGRTAEATTAHERACALLHTAGDWHTAATAQGNLARCLHDAGRPGPPSTPERFIPTGPELVATCLVEPPHAPWVSRRSAVSSRYFGSFELAASTSIPMRRPCSSKSRLIMPPTFIGSQGYMLAAFAPACGSVKYTYAAFAVLS